jgi:hypothetical protein
MQTWSKHLALAAGIALVAGGCGTAEPTLATPGSARRDLAPQQVSPPPADTTRDERWGGFIGGGGV